MKAALPLVLVLGAGPAAALESVVRSTQECYAAEPWAGSGCTLEIASGAGELTARPENASGSIGADLSLTAEGGRIMTACSESAVLPQTVAPCRKARDRISVGPVSVSHLEGKRESNPFKSAEVRSTALVHGARLYREIALCADERPEHVTGHEKTAPPPVIMLTAHGTDLSIQSTLVNFGVSDSERAGNELGHDLNTQWERLVDLSGSSIDLPKFARNQPSNLSAGHDGFVFRDHSFGKREKYVGAHFPVHGPSSGLAVTFLALREAPFPEEYT